MPKKSDTKKVDFKETLWKAADKLRNQMDAAEYKHIVLGLIFLKYISDTFDIQKNSMEVHHKRAEPWTVTLVDTGDHSMTGGRLRRVSEYVKNEDAFCFTYGDGISDINISKLIKFNHNNTI